MVKVMEKVNQERERDTLFLRFSGELVTLAEWVEEQAKTGGFRNRQDFVLNILREAKKGAETETALAK
jgi:hypothetical protein